MYNYNEGLGGDVMTFSSVVISQAIRALQQPLVLPVQADHKHGPGHLVHLGLEAVRPWCP